MDHTEHDRNKDGFFASRTNIVLIAFLAIGGFYLVAEHRAHLIPFLGYLPLLLILACPLLHIFMHGGHGGHGGGGDADEVRSDKRQNSPPHQH
ncbi:DUF2933 domain-containing protein [Dongia sp.]|uniref:DUF2933 domain-containing protein n=1 Tax=Dongia sp. TaxID=1977262 RepID=UPI0037512BD2